MIVLQRIKCLEPYMPILPIESEIAAQTTQTFSLLNMCLYNGYIFENFIKLETLSNVSSSTYLYPGCKLLQQFQRFATWTFLDINYSFYLNKRKFDIKKKIQISCNLVFKISQIQCIQYIVRLFFFTVLFLRKLQMFMRINKSSFCID